MTPHPSLGQASHGTGDILLASALAAVGIPFDPHSPCAVINRDNGKTYGRWFLLPTSADGKHDTHKLDRAWSGLEVLPANHPFVWLMDFVKHGRGEGCRTIPDWMGAAHDHCRDLEIKANGLPRSLAQVEGLIAKLPEARESYVFAFVHCRDLAFRLYQHERNVQVMQTRGGASSLIDVRLPKPARIELLSRLDG